MALTIGTNVASLQASAAASSVNRDLETSMARLSTGKRINSAADDAAGVAIASRLSSEIRGTDQAIRNALDGQALIDTAEGGHKEIEEILQRMREVAIQSANDTNSAQDRGNLNAEMKALTTEIDRIAGVTTWAGNSVMSGTGSANSTKTFSLQVGAATGAKNQIAVAIGAMDTATLGVKGAVNGGAITFGDTGTEVNGATSSTSSIFTPIQSAGTSTVATSTFNFSYAVGSGSAVTAAIVSDTAYATTTATAAEALKVGTEIAAKINSNATLVAAGIGATVNDTTGVVTLNAKEFESVDSKEQAMNAVKNIDAAMLKVSTQRSELGAVSNRLTHTVSNMTNVSTNLSAARGGIEDADFALETTNLAKNQILQQASTAMLAQANASKQNVLSLLRG
jgi:flagellin